EVEAVKSRGISGAGDTVDLHPNRIMRRRCFGGVDLELLRHRADIISERAKQGRVTNRRGRDDTRQEEDVDHSREPTDRAGVKQVSEGRMRARRSLTAALPDAR